MIFNAICRHVDDYRYDTLSHRMQDGIVRPLLKEYAVKRQHMNTSLSLRIPHLNLANQDACQ